MDAHHGHRALRLGRSSQHGSSYFITVCTSKRRKFLTRPGIPELIFSQLIMQKEHMTLRASVVMPDHIHFVAVLNDSTLNTTLGVFKGACSRRINVFLNRSGSVWQRGYFDHKFRTDEEIGPILHYMWNNPEKPGRNFRCCKDDWFWFKSMVTRDVSYPAWLSTNPMG